MICEMSRTERLERWASVLEGYDQTPLSPFREVEFLAGATVAPLRQANSPLSVAYDDPVLRRAGLESDRYGEGTDFFGLSRGQSHRLLCSCGYMGAMRGTEVAKRIRHIVAREQRQAWRPANPLPALARWLSGWLPIARPARSA